MVLFLIKIKNIVFLYHDMMIAKECSLYISIACIETVLLQECRTKTEDGNCT